MGIAIDEFTHRRGGFEDAAQIRALTRAAYAHWADILGRKPLPMTADYEVALAKHRFDFTLRRRRYSRAA